jgi:hypothetical protein
MMQAGEVLAAGERHERGQTEADDDLVAGADCLHGEVSYGGVNQNWWRRFRNTLRPGAA